MFKNKDINEIKRKEQGKVHRACILINAQCNNCKNCNSCLHKLSHFKCFDYAKEHEVGIDWNESNDELMGLKKRYFEYKK